MRKPNNFARLLVAVLAACVSLPATAQMRGAVPPPFAGPARGITIGPPHAQQLFRHSFRRPEIFWIPPWPVTYEAPDVPPAAAPSVVVLQVPPPAPVVEQNSKPTEPLVIEWQGDRYVRVGSQASSGLQNVDAAAGSTPARKLLAANTSKPEVSTRTELPPAVLVYRDGHRESVGEYSIVGGTLYTPSDYWQSGSWTRRISISTLDVPSTLAANREAGVKFVLPSGPNVVVTRP